jgi:SPP1 gp7 family putative phage head morphogenesis protein
MSEICCHNEITVNAVHAVDPTHTTALRNAFARDMKKHFSELIVVIKKAVVDQDVFGLNRNTLQHLQMTVPTQQAFAFPRSQDKVRAFMAWLKKQEDAGILMLKEFEQVGDAINDAWTNKYIVDSYKRGVIRARYELNKAGFEVPSMEQTGGISMSMQVPFHIDRVGLLYTRVFNELKGITDQMDSLISRVLAQGMADGDNPRVIARKLVAVINGEGVGDLGITTTTGRFIPAMQRAEMLARTEIIRAHHQATIQEYRNWAVYGVVVKGEWMTAGDGRVCDQCASLQGNIYTLDEINNMIPLHPRCRCIALPFKVS